MSPKGSTVPVSFCTTFINLGMGRVVAALLAREVAKRMRVDFPLRFSFANRSNHRVAHR